MNENSDKRSQFRKQIRRRQIQQLFCEGRHKQAEQQELREHERVKNLMETPFQRKKWIEEKRALLNSLPNRNWLLILKELKFAAKYFKPNYQDWIQSGIIELLVNLLRQQHRELGLMDSAACVLQEVYYYIDDNTQAQTIASYGLAPLLMQLVLDLRFKAINYLDLINTMIYQRPNLKEIFISNGFVQALVIRLKSYTQIDNDQVSIALSVVYRLLKCGGYQKTKSIHIGNIIAVFLPILDSFIIKTKSNENLRVILKSVCELAMTEKQSILADIFRCQHIIPTILSLLSQGETQQLRAASAYILAQILKSNYLDYSRQLVTYGLVDRLLACYRINNNHQSCLHSILTCLSNIVGNSEKQAWFIMKHPIFVEFVIPCAKATNNLTVYKTAIFCICTMIHFTNKEMLDELITNFQLLEILVGVLSCFAPCITTVMEVLSILKFIIHVDASEENNIIIIDLQRYYNIETVLIVMDERLKNNLVHAHVVQLLDLMK